MVIYTILQTSSDPELDDSIYQYGYQDYNDAVYAANQLITNDRVDYTAETEIHTIKDDDDKITSFELWTVGSDQYLESVVIDSVIIK